MFLRRSSTFLQNKNLTNNYFNWTKCASVSKGRYFCSGVEKADSDSAKKSKLAKGPGLKEFLIAGKNLPINPSYTSENVPYLNAKDYSGNGRKVFFEVYGCQMNVNDTEIVWSILKDNAYVKVDDIKQADVVLVVTCAIREGAESKVSLIL